MHKNKKAILFLKEKDCYLNKFTDIGKLQILLMCTKISIDTCNFVQKFNFNILSVVISYVIAGLCCFTSQKYGLKPVLVAYITMVMN